MDATSVAEPRLQPFRRARFHPGVYLSGPRSDHSAPLETSAGSAQHQPVTTRQDSITFSFITDGFDLRETMESEIYIYGVAGDVKSFLICQKFESENYELTS